MAGVVYALLVGIDKYPKPQHSLDGCRNDVEAMEELLRGRIPEASLRVETLLDDAAKRGPVIEMFRKHLGRAGADDIALFFYAGHGSRERAPQEFWTIEPDRLDETLVLWDSREPGGWDLADKELAALIRPVANVGAHVVVILDSCHSGSATREIAASSSEKVRRFVSDVRDRAIETFIPEVQAVAAERARESGWDLGDDGRHILMAACCDDQEAKEYTAGGKKRGTFSFFLVEALRESPGVVTYRDVAARVRARVVANVSRQEPLVEATENQDLDRAFLDGALQPRTVSFLATEQDGAWWIDAGRIQGVPQPIGGERARVALFSDLSTSAEMAKVGQALAIAEIAEVQATRSRIEVARGALVSGQSYKAVVISTPIPMRRVRLTGNVDAIAAVRAALQDATFVAEGDADADFLLECSDTAFRLRRGTDGLELTAAATTAAEAVAKVEHLTRWRHFAELANPVSTIADSEFEVKVFSGRAGENELPGSDIRLTATWDGAALVSPQFRVRFANKGTRDLYFAVLALDELFACTPDLIKAGVLRLRPGDAPGWAQDGKPLRARIAKELRDEGRTEARDILKVIVSTAPFGVDSAVLDPLGVPRSRRVAPEASNTLERLLARARSRTISPASDDDEIRDFQTRTLFITTVEPRAAQELSPAAPVDVGAGVTLAPHPALRARACLTAVEQTRSDLGSAILPPLFRSHDAGETIRFTSSRGSAPALSVLELIDVADHTAVTPASPLTVNLPEKMLPGDVILSVAFDGEDYLILGRGTPSAAGCAVTLSRLPYPVRQRARSLTGSIKILFQKFAAPILGTKYVYPLLAASEWDDGKVRYDTDKASIKSKVAEAKRVIVFVHGIIGDTRGMGARLTRRPGDLYLTYDYENLHTTIEKNAEGLRNTLTECGLGEGHGKELIIVAHSMGGLVSRWFIEELGGRTTVSRVILCGTPNAGSNWATIEDWVTGTASLALNQLTKISWEANAVAWLFEGLERIDVSFDEMRPDSKFLKTLAAHADPGMPYTVLAGNTSLAGASDGPRVQRLLKKVLHKTTSIAFLFEPNDMAVSVTSIGSVGAMWSPRPETHEVACDHVSYFSSEAGLTRLRALLD